MESMDLRDHVRLMLPPQWCNDIERGIFNYCVAYTNRKQNVASWEDQLFRSLYMNTARRVIVNLDNDSYVNKGHTDAAHIIHRLEKEEVKPYEIANMRPEDMCPFKWKEIIETRLQKEHNTDNLKLEAKTDLFTCFKCMGRSCTYTQQQVRSADEPMTLFITCTLCENKWRI